VPARDAAPTTPRPAPAESRAPSSPARWQGIDRVGDAIALFEGPSAKPALLWGGDKLLQVATDASLTEAYANLDRLRDKLRSSTLAAGLKAEVVLHRDRRFFCTVVLLPAELENLRPDTALWAEVRGFLGEGVLGVDRASYCARTQVVMLDDGSGRPARPLYRCDAP
jgi:hypothetical protein